MDFPLRCLLNILWFRLSTLRPKAVILCFIKETHVNQNVSGAKRVTNFLRYGGLCMRVLGVIANYTCLV